MQCYHPIHVRSPDGSSFVVPCGKCFACQSNRRKEFAFRLKEEQKHSVCSFTVTLTYDDCSLPPLEEYFTDDPVTGIVTDRFYYHPLRVDDVQRFIKVLRKTYKLRYFCVGEYGTHSNRPHYHIIFFFKSVVNYYDFDLLVRKKWLYGRMIKTDITNDACIEYTLKYCLKLQGVNQPSPKILCSKNPFIGYNYFTWERLKYHMRNQDDYTVQDGKTVRLPRIYRRIYTDNMRNDNTKCCLIKACDCINQDYTKAESRGLTYEEFIDQRRSDFTKRCLKSIKKKQL